MKDFPLHSCHNFVFANGCTLRVFEKCSFLDPLSNEQISKLAGALESTSYADGEYVIRQGDTGESFYIIEEGTVKCTQLKASGREVDLLLVCDVLFA